MAEPLANYFRRTNPVEPRASAEPLGPPAPDLQVALTRLTRQLWGTMPAQLDRARSFRNRFLDAVQ